MPVVVAHPSPMFRAQQEFPRFGKIAWAKRSNISSRDLEINSYSTYALKWPARRVPPSCSFLPQTHPTAQPAAATDVAYPY